MHRGHRNAVVLCDVDGGLLAEWTGEQQVGVPRHRRHRGFGVLPELSDQFPVFAAPLDQHP